MRTAVPPPKRAADAAADDPLVAELERLWERSSDAAPTPEVRPARRRVDVPGLLSKALVVGWVVFFVALFAAAPPADAAVATPAWVEAASVAIVLAVLVAAFTAATVPGFALACSALAAGLGIPVGIACRATEHHAGAWWMVETGAFAALAVASIACLATRRGR